MKRAIKIFAYSLITLLLVVFFAIWLVSTEKVQNLLVQRAVNYLSEKLHTKVSVGHVKLTFFNSFDIEKVYLEDDKQDTLAYVGTLSLRATELLPALWNKENITIKSVGLSDVFVHINRKKESDRWNFQFIADAFASDTSSAPDSVTTHENEKKSTSKSYGLTLDLKKVSLSNIRFYMDDAWRGEDMRFVIQELGLNMKHLNLDAKDIGIDALKLSGANVLVKEYEGGKPEDNTPDDTTTWGTPFNPDGYKIALNSLSLSNGSFYYQAGSGIPQKGTFDAQHIGIENLSLDLSGTRIWNDTIFSSINNLNAKERSGLRIDKLKGDLKLSQVQASLSNLLLKTEYSEVGPYFEMSYRNFHDFEDFVEKVSLKASLTSSSVSSLDIGYFAPILNQYPIAVAISGEAEGLIGNLKARNLKLKTLNTSFEGSGVVEGLPDVNKAHFDIDIVSLRTSGSDLNRLIPQTKSNAVAWNHLKEISYRGTFHGMVDEFSTKGDLETNLGVANLDLKMDFKPKNPSYEGKIKTTKFDIGKLVKQEKIGVVSINGKIKGSGFELNSINTNLNATVDEIVIENQVYKNLTINGLVANKKFDGIFISQDPNLSLNFDGKVDLYGKVPSYNFNSRFLKINFQKLGITKEPIIGSGIATLNFTGDNIDNFRGTATLKNLLIEHGSQKYFLDYLSLNSTKMDDHKILNLQSSVADANLEGDFDISYLPSAFQLYLYHYLPEYIDKPKSYKEEAFTFDINIKEVDSLLSIFYPAIKSASNVLVSGDLNTQLQKFSLDVNIPKLTYDNIEVNNLLIVGAGDFTSFDLTANGSELKYNNDVLIPSYQLVSSMSHDTASFSFNSQSINEILGEATINAKATALNQNLYVSVLPSTVSIRNDQWQLYSNHQLVFGEKILIKDFIAESGAQSIVVNSSDNASNDINAVFRMIDLEGISAMFALDDVKVFGRINGQVDLIDPRGDLKVKAQVSSATNIRFNKDTLGMVNANVDYDIKKQILHIHKNTTIKQSNGFANVSGNINVQDSSINIITELNKVDISPVGQFISDYIANLRGTASGEVDIVGKLSDPQITGNINLSQTALKVLFLGTSYTIDNANLHFNNRKIELEDLYLKDEREGNHVAKLKGNITHRNFNDFALRLQVTSNDFLCMNTKSYENDLFYGYVPAKVNVLVEGPIDNISVDVEARPLKGAQFHLPINSSGDISSYDYIKFANIGRNQGDMERKETKPYYLNLSLNVEATPDAEVFIVLDQNTGEEIRAKGNGAIKLNVDLGNSISMFGNYAISEGKYLFNFRGLIPREFTIEENSKLSWSGDALEAQLDVKAIYKLPKNLPLLPLVNTQYNTLDESDQQEAKRAYTTFVNLMLKGSLVQPDIKFDITQPDNKAIGTAGYRVLEQIKNDEKELVSQAGVLLLLGEFKASDGLANSTYRGSIATVSDMISSALSSEVTNLFQKLTGLKNVSLNLGYQNYGGDEITNQSNRNEFKVNVTANLLKDRVILDVGNSVDVGRNADGTTSSNFFGGDFKAQILLSEDGRYRATAYRINSSNNIDVDARNYTKSGIGLSYRKVFNNFGDLFISKKKRKQRTLPPETSSSNES